MFYPILFNIYNIYEFYSLQCHRSPLFWYLALIFLIILIIWNEHGAHFRNGFSIVIQIRWQIGFSVIPMKRIISLQNFEHAMTAQLSCTFQTHPTDWYLEHVPSHEIALMPMPQNLTDE